MFYLLQAVISLSSALPWWALLLSSCSLRRQNQHAGEGCTKGEGRRTRGTAVWRRMWTGYARGRKQRGEGDGAHPR